MELNEKQFISGFNSGYILAEYEPRLLTELLNNIRPVTSYISGLSSGQKEYELEQAKSHLNELGQLRGKNRDERNKTLD